MTRDPDHVPPPSEDPGWHWPEPAPPVTALPAAAAPAPTAPNATTPDATTPVSSPPTTARAAPHSRAGAARALGRRVAAVVALAFLVGAAAGYVLGRRTAPLPTADTPATTPTAHTPGSPAPAPTPPAATLGTAIRAADGATYTVLVYGPITNQGGAPTPQSGAVFQGINVQICAGDTTDEIISAFDFRLQLASGARLLPVVLPNGSAPMLDTNIVAPGQCARGWIAFDPPERPALVTIAHTDLSWRLG